MADVTPRITPAQYAYYQEHGVLPSTLGPAPPVPEDTDSLGDLRHTAFRIKVVAYAMERGWHCYWTQNSRKSPEGFPDLVLLRPPRGIAAELKTGRGKLTAQQAVWLDLFRQIPGFDAWEWRPTDWDTIQAALR